MLLALGEGSTFFILDPYWYSFFSLFPSERPSNSLHNFCVYGDPNWARYSLCKAQPGLLIRMPITRFSLSCAPNPTSREAKVYFSHHPSLMPQVHLAVHPLPKIEGNSNPSFIISHTLATQ
jgi:hypothetical protein